MGLKWLAVLVWPQLGRDADRTIGIGIGARAFEACFLSILAAVPVIGGSPAPRIPIRFARGSTARPNSTPFSG